MLCLYAEGSYYETYKMVRDITGVGEGNGPMVAFHTGFDGLSKWAGFLSGADRIVLGTHLALARNVSELMTEYTFKTTILTLRSTAHPIASL